MMYKWGHPVATLPGDEGDNTSLLQNKVNYANQYLVLDFYAFKDFCILAQPGSGPAYWLSQAVSRKCTKNWIIIRYFYDLRTSKGLER
eukprot:6183076-Pleurochrysis_carterae.AAC.1